jgi:hypothetical protein
MNRYQALSGVYNLLPFTTPKSVKMKNLLPSPCFVLLLTAVYAASAQTAFTDDFRSADAIIGALYEVISGAPGEKRNWDRFRNLFASDARLIPTLRNQDGKLAMRPMKPDEYIALFENRIPTGFYERELHRITEQFGTVTHVFSTYETRDTNTGPVTNRGINSIQLFYDGQRFYIVTIFWCAESMGYTLPEKYLKSAER